MNFNSVNCPNCNSAQPYLRTPKNLRQALWGGYTCKECGCEMDSDGMALKTNADK